MMQSPFPTAGYMREADGMITTSYTPPTKALMLSHSRQPSATAYPESAPFLSAYANHGVTGSTTSAFYDPYRESRSATPTQSSGVGPSIRGSERHLATTNDFDPYAAGSTSALSSQNEKLRLANERVHASALPNQGFASHHTTTRAPVEGSDASAVAPEEIVIQHQDSGVAIIRELPPPYAGLPAPSSPS